MFPRLALHKWTVSICKAILLLFQASLLFVTIEVAHIEWSSAEYGYKVLQKKPRGET